MHVALVWIIPRLHVGLGDRRESRDARATRAGLNAHGLLARGRAHVGVRRGVPARTPMPNDAQTCEITARRLNLRRETAIWDRN